MEMLKKILKPLIPLSMRARLLRLRKRLDSDPTESGETAAIRELLKDEDVRYLIDVGAHDGYLYSNSYEFIKEGWEAILIEPLPKAYLHLQERYKGNLKVKCLNIACSDETKKGLLYMGADGDLGMTSTLCTDQNSWFDRNRTEKKIEVQVKTLTDVLVEAKAPSQFALLLIDTEGMDLEVLQGLDFERFSPRIILTENYFHLEKFHNKEDLLRSKGYRFVKSIEGNSIWIQSAS